MIQSTMLCPSCGTESDPGSKFCSKCGEKLEPAEILRKCQGKSGGDICGQILKEGINFCPSCGTKVLQKRTCSHCSSILEETAKFCTNCGTQLLETHEEDSGKEKHETKSDDTRATECDTRIDNNELSSLAVKDDIESLPTQQRHVSEGDESDSSSDEEECFGAGINDEDQIQKNANLSDSAGAMTLGHSSLNLGSDMYEDNIEIRLRMDRSSLKDRSKDFGIFKKPRRLLSTNAQNVLTINHEVLDQLSQIKKKICAVGICGQYRTGKSYIMNWLAGVKSGFALGDTIQSETRGIWLWCKDHPTKKDHVLLLIDTEGFGDLERADPEHDNRLFCISILISSVIIINVKERIDYNALDKLAFITKLSNKIKILRQDDDEKGNARSIPVVSPRLIMCIRDSHLKFEKDGIAITPDRYLETALEISTSKNRHQKMFNDIKNAIQNYFPDRKCFPVSQPATGNNLQDIESMDESSLNKQFIEDATVLRKYVYDMEPKTICNASRKAVDGADLATLITTYVDALRSGAPLQYEDAYTHVAFLRNERVSNEIMTEFRSEMRKGRDLKSKQKLQDMYLKQHEIMLTEYRKKSYLYKQDNYEDEVQRHMDDFVKEIRDEIRRNCKEEGAKKLWELYEAVLKKYQTETATVDSYTQFEADMSTLENRFMLQMSDYDEDDVLTCLADFKNSITDDKMAMYRASTRHLDQERYSQRHEEIESILNDQREQAIQLELGRRKIYMEEELNKLQRSYENLSSKVESRRWCLIM